MAYHVHHGIDVVVRQGSCLLSRVELRRQCEGVFIPTERIHDHVHGIALARTRVTDVDALAWEIADVLDSGIRAGHHGQRLTVHGEDGTHIFPSAFFFKVGLTVVSAVLNVRLHNAHIQLTALHAVDVSNGTTGRRGVTTDVVLIAATVNHAAHRLTNDIVNTGLTSSTDGDVALLGNGRRGKGCRRNERA